MLVSGIQIMAADDDIHADAPGLHELLALRTCLAAHHGCADIVALTTLPNSPFNRPTLTLLKIIPLYCFI